MSKTRIILADDHLMFRSGVMNLLRNEQNIVVVGEARDGEEALRLALAIKPDVIVMDLHLPVMDGIVATREILKEMPDARILALTSYDDDESIENMLKAGAKGYILKDAPISELVLAIQAVAVGNSYFTQDISAKLLSLFNRAVPSASAVHDLGLSLTSRELEVLECVAAEMTNKEIANKLFISKRTVESHRRKLIQKLKVKNTAGLMKYYLSHYQNDDELQ